MSLCTRSARPAVLALALAALSALLMPPAPVRAQAASGVTVAVLHKANYSSTLTVGPDGSLFGTEGTYPGTIFKVTLGGVFHTLITFNTTNGADPTGGPLLLLPDGSFFGSTIYGGKSFTGVLFQFTPTRRYQVKHEFASVSGSGSGNDEHNVRGAYPEQPMVRASDGAIYGATARGGSTGSGVIFRYTAAHGVEVVHNFAQNANCLSGLTLGPDGALYGASEYGSFNGVGQIFRCTTTGDFSLLHTFTGADGQYPNGAPVFGRDGALYGTTNRGGVGSESNGVIYRITTGGDFTLLHTFTIGDAISQPNSALAVGPDGKFYGKTFSGPQSQGGIFRVTADGTVTLLYQNPTSAENIGASNTAPVFGRDNRLYVSGSSNIYKITVPF